MRIFLKNVKRAFMKKLIIATAILCMAVFSIQAQVTITGTVLSADDGLGLPGAAVIVKGTTLGTTTDFDGKYTLKVPEGATELDFSFVGMQKQTVAINGQTVINVTLKSDVFKMEEVIVSGVASGTPKRKMSVSVAKVDSKDLEAVPGTSAATALQGKVAGVTIVSGNGNPGGSANIRLRGTNSLMEGQAPLILVDGVSYNGELSDINADDIESYEVVKGASAASLYGSKAGSGVIVITTKRGKLTEEGLDIKVSNEYGISAIARKIKIAEHHPYQIGDDYKQPGYTKYSNVTYPTGYAGGADPNIKGSRLLDYDNFADNPYSYVNDPQDELFLPGSYYKNYLSLASSGKKTALFFSFDNSHNSGIVFNTKGSDRLNYKINVDLKPVDNIKITSSTLLTQTNVDMPSSDDPESEAGGSSSPFFNALLLSPDVDLNMDAPQTSELRKYYYKPDPWSIGENPKHALFYDKRKHERRGIIQNFSSNLRLTDWVNFDVDYSFEKENYDFEQYRPTGFQSSSGSSRGYGYRAAYSSNSNSFQTTANMQTKFGDLVLKAKLSYLFEKTSAKYFNVSAVGMLAPGVTSMDNLTDITNTESNKVTIIAKNYFGVVDMDYKEKYIASILYRLDGSSLFGVNNRWNPYYRASFAYRINEDLKLPGFQELKIRYAIGTSGQRPGFSYQYEIIPITPNVGLNFNGAVKANKNLKPANTTEQEYAISGQFLDKFEFELIRSVAETEGVFFVKPLDVVVTGFSGMIDNVITTESKTWEATFGAQIIKGHDWDWHLNISFDKVTQIIKKSKIPPTTIGPVINNTTQVFYLREGETVGTVYGHDWVRSLDQMQKQLPQGKTIDDYVVNSEGYVIPKGSEGTKYEIPVLVDQNNDSIPDELKIADMNPDFNMSMSSRLSWKNLGFTMLWVFKKGGDIYNLTKQAMYIDNRYGDVDQSGKPEWEKKTIQYYSTFYEGAKVNKYFIEDGTYVKLREVSLYYTLGKNLFSKIKIPYIKSGKISLLGRNLLTFTNYSGWDPEVSLGNNATYAFDYFNYPNYRTYSVSLELTF